MDLARFNPAEIDPRLVTQRRARIATIVLLLVGPAILILADVHWKTGFNGLKLAHLVLFFPLFALLAFGVAQAFLGFLLRRDGDPYRIINSVDSSDRAPIRTPTAIVMPICNEEVGRVMAALRVMYQSVTDNGELPDCDFFLLSDSSHPNRWVEEEAAWLALTQQLGAHGRIFYRRRRVGINKKAGNLADFCRRWGRHYRYMVVLDADSVMTGGAITQLARLMERNPGVGIIQAVPSLINGETILARVQQFASRLYGNVFATGLNYWQLGEANYWGHNAIVRLAPFIRHCSLPELPGDGPFGGRILSHDYVEAALMRRAGWQVWLATDLDGNYEECPANIIDFAKRDRRWLQGNLQHAKLIVARGFYAVNRLHFTLGILSYLASPLWLVFTVLSVLIAYREGASHAGTAGNASWFAHPQSLALFAFTLVLLFAPKVLALLDLRRRPAELAAFGGWRKVSAGVVTETLIFTLLAPILMLFHTKFVVLTLCRQSVTWGAQRRGRAGAAAWSEAVQGHRGHTMAGLAGSVILCWIDPTIALWTSPILAGLILSIPISFVTGSLDLGQALHRSGLFMTPEETSPPPELSSLAEILGAQETSPLPPLELADDYGLLQAVIDPYVNAAHVALLRCKSEVSAVAEGKLATLRATLLRQGPHALSQQEKISLLQDLDSMNALHHELWCSPSSRLAPWWQLALERYHVLAPTPRTPLHPASPATPPSAEATAVAA